MSLIAGLAIEKIVSQYLLQQGLTLIVANYRSRWGEIDLVMRDSEYLVFVEVRARTSGNYGDGATSITIAKQRKIIKTALHYLSVYKLHDKHPVRFDVLSVHGKQNEIEWIKNAFSGDY